ncbi:MAG: alkaline phosphatase family protein [Ignavibacteriaceae bacterium]|nr:alkaline phosphatase family protein [Ignavibacteriaceae bacterium]
MIFIDGVGIGKPDYQYNPFFKYGFKTFTEIFGAIPTLENLTIEKNNKYIFPVDANLGVDGFPQSGTGQTSIFCGINAPKFVGKHFGPFPYSTLIPIIGEKNILKHYRDDGKKSFFANAYPKRFFDYLKSGKTRLSVTTLSCRLSDIPLNRTKDVRAGKALTAEITNARWNLKLNLNMPVITPTLAAKRLLRFTAQNDFTLYEYYITDHLGHGRYDGETESTLKILDEFLLTIITKLPDDVTLLICSDHGNFEDLSVKTHTRNPALTIAAGKNAKQLFEEIKDLTQIKSAIIKNCK